MLDRLAFPDSGFPWSGSSRPSSFDGPELGCLLRLTESVLWWRKNGGKPSLECRNVRLLRLRQHQIE